MSLKELIRAISLPLGSAEPTYPLSESLVTTIDAYVEKHVPVEEHDSQRLHDELVALYNLRVRNNPQKHPTFLACLKLLRPALSGVDRLLQWWDLLVRPTLDSLGQTKMTVADARDLVLSILDYDEDDDSAGERGRESSALLMRLFEIYLLKLQCASADPSIGYAEEEKHRFVSSNIEAVLLAFGKRKPKALMNTIDGYIMQKEFRLQTMGLLCSFVRLQGPHLYLVLQTSLLEHLIQCLLHDTSTTVISLAMNSLVMFLPHICNSLGPFLPRLFLIYTRLLLWDKHRARRPEETRGLDESEKPSGASTPLSDGTSSPGSEGWQKLDSSFETADSTAPEMENYFTFLYGLYPINFFAFLREPYKYLTRANYKALLDLEIDESTVRSRTEQYRARHIIHPNFLTLTEEAELSDQTRWMKVEPSDVVAQCIGLVSTPGIQQQTASQHIVREQLIPDSLLPTDDIPDESLLSSDDAGISDSHSWRDTNTTLASSNGSDSYSLFPKAPTQKASPIRHQHTNSRNSHDSPTLPAHDKRTNGQMASDDQLEEMLHLHETLRSSLTDNVLSDTSSKTKTASLHGSSATASPRLEAYVQSLNSSQVPRSPAIRPASSDLQGTVSFLQREVMLLKNDLNFERYLKQQHLSHIGHLQRKHIKDSTTEAETQNLVNTNKALKLKLEEAKKAFSRTKAEALKDKNQSKKWEAELNTKLRSLREEQKIWKAEEEVVKSGLENAKLECDQLRRLLVESEAKELESRQRMTTIEANSEEINQLRAVIDHLNARLTEYEARAEEYEMQKHQEDAAVSQAERLKLRLKSRELEMQKIKKAYDFKLQELQSRVSSLQNPMPSQPPPAFQQMLDQGLAVSNQKLISLRKAHNQLLTRYTELEIRYIELQAQQELESLPMRSSQQQQQYGGLPRYQEGMHAHLMHSGDEKYPLPPSNAHSFSEPNSPMDQASYDGANYTHFHAGSSPHSASVPIYPAGPNVKYIPGNHSATHDMFPTPPLRTMPSLSGSVLSSADSISGHTITSTGGTSTKSQDKNKVKIKPGSEIRVRGRGGVQNIGKKDKEKKEGKKFGLGVGLANVKNFL